MLRLTFLTFVLNNGINKYSPGGIKFSLRPSRVLGSQYAIPRKFRRLKIIVKRAFLRVWSPTHPPPPPRRSTQETVSHFVVWRAILRVWPPKSTPTNRSPTLNVIPSVTQWARSPRSPLAQIVRRVFFWLFVLKSSYRRARKWGIPMFEI